MQEPRLRGADKLLGKAIFAAAGEKLGTADHFINSRITEVPQWIVVEAGLLGLKKLIVPVAGNFLDDDGVHIPYTSEEVRSEPECNPDNLTPELDDALNAHFGLGATTGA
jgi:hypothetical protein